MRGDAAVAERYLTVPEVAEQLRVNEDTVRRWLRDRRLRGFMPGGARGGYRVRESELERFVSELEAGAAEEPTDDR
jgi:excisionase family DNA binding protein